MHLEGGIILVDFVKEERTMTTHSKSPAAIAIVQPNPEPINYDRRKFLANAAMGAAAAGAASLFGLHPAPAATEDAIRPFHIDVPEDALVDLRRRLAATRWPDKEIGGDGVRMDTDDAGPKKCAPSIFRDAGRFHPTNSRRSFNIPLYA